MKWSKVLVAGLVAGVVKAVYEWLIHGFVFQNTYTARAELFRSDANVFWFPLITILVCLVGAGLFAKTRSAWGAGIKGGLNFGLWPGLIFFFSTFSFPLIFKGFPYFLSWCWGSVDFIGWLIAGVVLSLVYKEQA